jgi:ubiquinone/menaquinone biosynthesis C-methylase UbiE
MFMGNPNESASFEDHFSKHSQLYLQHRPTYPEEIYAYLASIAPGQTLAWDCGTGNGQAAAGLAKYFARVYATDASAEQIARAQPCENVEYHVEPAEHVSLADSCVDLITVAVAVHWFDFEMFYREVRRVLKPDGVLSVWTYSFTEISPEIDTLVRQYYYDVLDGFWPERIHYLEEQYKTLPFPFEEVQPPSFAMERNFRLEEYAGFLDSWSATQRYKEQKGHHPLDAIWEQMSAAWGSEPRRVRWPLYFRIGKNGSA